MLLSALLKMRYGVGIAIIDQIEWEFLAVLVIELFEDCVELEIFSQNSYRIAAIPDLLHRITVKP
jgi:hypothetical protein